MKKLAVFTLSLFFTGIGFTLKSQEMTPEQKMSYALGSDIANSFRNLGLTVDQNAFFQGVTDGLAQQLKMTPEELQEQLNLVNQNIQQRQREMQEAQMAQQSKDAEVEKEKGKTFLTNNKKQKGVVETPSGLQYKVVTMGKGAKPKATDNVKVHYHGTLIDGTVFDSSVERGEPITFPLNGVITGWTEGVQLMPAGSKFIFYIPSDLAYGDRAIGEVIKAGSTLIFEVELLDINPAN